MFVLIFVFIFVFVFSMIVTAIVARSDERFAPPDLGEYFRSLMQPDNPAISCCGAGDVYYADKTDQCGPDDMRKEPTCAIVAIITDTRPDVLRLDDGSTIHRAHVPPGTRVPIPRSKLRKHPIPNPTDHNVVFMRYDGDAGSAEPWINVYCWEPIAGL